jgi:hypothetical protein
MYVVIKHVLMKVVIINVLLAMHLAVVSALPHCPER